MFSPAASVGKPAAEKCLPAASMCSRAAAIFYDAAAIGAPAVAIGKPAASVGKRVAIPLNRAFIGFTLLLTKKAPLSLLLSPAQASSAPALYLRGA
jgi:hypothetical protein